MEAPARTLGAKKTVGRGRISYPGMSPLADRGSGGLEDAEVWSILSDSSMAIGLVLLLEVILGSFLDDGAFKSWGRVLFSMKRSVSSRYRGATMTQLRTWDQGPLCSQGAARAGQRARVTAT